MAFQFGRTLCPMGSKCADTALYSALSSSLTQPVGVSAITPMRSKSSAAASLPRSSASRMADNTTGTQACAYARTSLWSVEKASTGAKSSGHGRHMPPSAMALHRASASSPLCSGVMSAIGGLHLARTPFAQRANLFPARVFPIDAVLMPSGPAGLCVADHAMLKGAAGIPGVDGGVGLLAESGAEATVPISLDVVYPVSHWRPLCAWRARRGQGRSRRSGPWICARVRPAPWRAPPHAHRPHP
ncbi:hypothetical protein FE88_07735 [Azospirillum brasilense]|uniref:hypothetical protein n=1 Tax=Azospirillum phage Cd TaxID=467481 RepID=UPI000165BD67|nr:hypothetical protein APCd_gp58 [Azospirillum phage Cd]OPH16886.1 hypothetical protein FE89_02710 [Azospirillum brasilense]OPH21562.1 hypothetical protein FE88_07735 [Azospirillum brasilense]PWC97677.1 hypothetical protein AEJ54_00860 [Azospirillum sp. Sp 7]CAO99384.1 hypothetical protein [Azospirillum phage Cd]